MYCACGLQDEADLKADFPSMGTTPEIPRVFRTSSRVRNKNVTKRQTEMLVKEIWKVRMTHRKAGKACVDLPEMIFLHLQKTKGLLQAVIEVNHKHMQTHMTTDRPPCTTATVSAKSYVAIGSRSFVTNWLNIHNQCSCCTSALLLCVIIMN